MTIETMLDLFSLAGAALQSLGTQYEAALRQTNAELGLEGQDWNLLFSVQGIASAPITAALLQQFAPYIALEKLEQQLADAASRGLLQSDDSGSYRLTDHGRTALQQSFGAVHAALAAAEPLSADKIAGLNQLLRRLVEATLAAPAPAEKPELHASRLTDPGPHSPAAVLTDQYLTDLVRFRDDAHRAAWQPYGVGGPTWEALTLIWRGEAYSPDSLSKLLERRAQPPQVYIDAIHTLVERGWIAQHGEAYRVTDRGVALRQEAEAATDRLFYAPWSCLSEAEIEQLRGLLTQLRDRYAPANVESTS